MTTCACCPNYFTGGLCPICSTFWIKKPNGKRYGVLPVDRCTPADPTVGPFFLTQLPNVVKKVA